jgi:acetylglutamate kinase
MLKEKGVVADGMIPKLTNSFKAIDSGVARVVIKHARNLLSNKGTTLL